MTIIKKILHIIFSSFLIWQTIMLTERIIANRPIGFTDLLLDSIFINVFVTGIFTIVYQFPIYRLLPTRYYKINNPNLLQAFGKIIRIDLFKKLLLITIWRKMQNKKYFFSGFRNGFSDLEISTMKSEFPHFIGFAVVMILTIIIGIKASILQAIIILIINIFFNFYPVMLQRFHRMRLNKLKKYIAS